MCLRTILPWASLSWGALCYAPQLWAGVSFTVSGWASTTNVPYELHRTQSGSGAVAVDLGSMLRLGYSHRQELSLNRSYETDGVGIYPSSTEIHEYTNSIDLTLVLYNGDLVVPYVFGGLAHKRYTSAKEIMGVRSENSHPGFVVPAGGAGVGIRLNSDFSLKFFHTLSTGYKQNPGDETYERVLDSYSQVGVSYQI